MIDEETEEEEVVELNGMWDFILSNEEEQEALPISTRSKGLADTTQSNQKQKTPTPAAKENQLAKILLLKLHIQIHLHQIFHLHQRPW